MAKPETTIIIAASAFPKFNCDAETFPLSNPAIWSGVNRTLPTVNAFAVAYAENPLAKSNKRQAMKLGASKGTAIFCQYCRLVAPREIAASFNSARRTPIAGAKTITIKGI